jgi:serine/threonine protein kinase
MNNVNQTIGKYIIERQLGRRESGPLYLGYDPKLDRRVAIRVFVGFEGEALQDRLFREARAIGKLDHPNIVRICELDIQSNRPYVATEFIDGEDLGTVIEKKLFVPFVQKLQIIVQTCQALHYAHGKGIVHGRLSPGDIRIDSDGKAKIVDFDLAERTKDNPNRKLDCAADIFGAGGVLYEFISSVRPFDATRVYRPIQQVLPGCAPELIEILERALGNGQDHGFATCLEFAEALQSFARASTSYAGGLSADVVRLETEVDSQRKSLERLHIIDFHDSSLPDDGPPERMSLNSTGTDMAVDYGELLHRHASTHQKLHLFEEKLRGAVPVVQLLKTSYEQFDRGEFNNAQQTLQDLLNVSPAHALAQRLLESCRTAIDEEQRQREYEKRLKVAIKQAREAVERKQYSQAMLIADKILAIDPSQPEAVELRDAANRSKQAKNS